MSPYIYPYIVSPISSNTGVQRVCHSEELKNLFQRLGIVTEIMKEKLMWAGHVWRKESSIIYGKSMYIE